MSLPYRRLRAPAWLMGRWLLVGLVVAGVFGMHVLSAPDHGVGHGMVMTAQAMDSEQASVHGSAPSTSTIQMDGHFEVRSDQASAPAVPSTPPPMPAAMAMCLLFLAAAGAVVAILTLAGGRSDRAAGQRSATGLGLGHSWRDPPGAAPPRIALCILRV